MRKIFLSLCLMLVILVGLGGVNIFAGHNEENDDLISPKARKIVVFREGVGIQERSAVLKQRGTRIRHFSIVNASSVVLTDERVEAEGS